MKIAVLGTGIIGTAFTKLVLAFTNFDIVLFDTYPEKITSCIETLKLHKLDISRVESIDLSKNDLEQSLHNINLISCCTPYNFIIKIAFIAAKLNIHYIDFTEDVKTSIFISKLNVNNFTMVPQTGLAPGLISYIGLDLVKNKKVKNLFLRVGALPNISFGPDHYAITWSLEGLVNEYLSPTLQKFNNEIISIPALEELESIIINGIEYEAFTTSGGIGDLTGYENIRTVNYKTLRYPGHLSFLKQLLKHGEYNQEKIEKLALQTFKRTRNDIVALIVQSTTEDGESLTIGTHFYPNHELDLTALELTTAGTGVTIAELILTNKLPFGVLLPSQISLSALLSTTIGRFVIGDNLVQK